MERLLVGEYGCIQDLSLHEILENVAAVRQFRVITSPAFRYLATVGTPNSGDDVPIRPGAISSMCFP